VLVTNDLDFPQILAYTADSKPSVILLRGEPLIPELRARALLSGIAECTAELDAGAILTIDWTDKPRARLLPLK
jgi:predicted nuclease of predicted toxin-antitoxin system